MMAENLLCINFLNDSQFNLFSKLNFFEKLNTSDRVEICIRNGHIADNPFYTGVRYNDNIRNNGNLNGTNP